MEAKHLKDKEALVEHRVKFELDILMAEKKLAGEMGHDYGYFNPKIRNVHHFETNLKDFDHTENEKKLENYKKSGYIRNK